MPIDSMYTTNTTLRIGGLASGLDVDSIVKDLMEIEQLKVDRIKQQQQLIEWRKEDYREISGLLRTFQDEFFNIIKPETYMLSPNMYKTFQADSGGEEYITATANAEAMEGVYTIAGIDSIATSTIIKGVQGLPEGGTLNSTLEDLGFATADSVVKFSMGGQEEFAFSSKATIRQVMSEVSADSKAGVHFFYSSIEGKFMLQTKATGEATKDISLGDIEGSFLANLGLVGEGAEKIDGTDAVVRFKTMGGTDTVTAKNSTNTFTLDGVTYTVKQKTPVDTPITITVTRDTDKAFNNIKGFVDKYNELIDKINSKLSEERFRDFPPLTTAQRNEMSDKEAELWDEKARSGLLKGDAILQNIVYSMRRALNEAVEGVGISLWSIGINTGLYQERGKLHIDENKLKQALRNNTEQVMELFTKKSGIDYSPNLDSDLRAQRYGESGIIHRFSDILMDNIRTTRNKDGKKGILLEKAGIVGDITEFENLIDDELKRLDTRLDRAMDTMMRQENRYWNQFIALEKAIQRLNMQSMWLMQQFGSNQ